MAGAAPAGPDPGGQRPAAAAGSPPMAGAIGHALLHSRTRPPLPAWAQPLSLPRLAATGRGAVPSVLLWGSPLGGVSVKPP
ncbi:MAG: hypothetical protein FJ053_01915 [Cyanobacteria bacterium M_surface_10_m1_298]|nr:hypothetical protein [Cyanobacteria bacterium M_surface_10_m1_298]